MRIDRPAEGDDTPPARPESQAPDGPSAAGHEALDRVDHLASYRATVDAAYREYQAETAVTGGQKTYDANFDSWHSEGGSGVTSTGSAERDAYHSYFRVLVETEYRDTRWSQDTDLSASPQTSADSEGRLLHADADPLRALGPAFETHPDELQTAMARLDRAGVEVDLRPGCMSYSPGAAEGKPGRLILDPDASYGAVLHEMSHFADDESAGYPGMRYWFEDPTVTAAGESRAYQAEIDYANSIDETEIADRLEELKTQRISELLVSENDE